MDRSTEVIKLAIGIVDGANPTFETPTEYVPGSARGIVNGLTYDPSDPVYGITETPYTEITFAVAPKVGSVIQVFYSETPFEGSPFDPAGVLP
jgi:hypothetical protein